ncbi:MAG: PASTA domain-containing protein [Thermoanaerobaculales bacterium]
MAVRLLFAVVFAVFAGVVFWFSLVHTVHRGTLAVPDLRQASLEEARRQAHDLGLVVAVEEPGIFSSTVPPGEIAHQQPSPGFHVKAGSTITVRISLGGERLAVPDIRAGSLQTALRELEQAGLNPGVQARVQGQAASDRVIASGPPNGTEVAPSTAVDLLVNTAPRRQLWVMPSLFSQPLGWVRRYCRVNRLRLGQEHEVSYPGLSAGVVLRQYPPAGSPLAPSDIITVWVSK